MLNLQVALLRMGAGLCSPASPCPPPLETAQPLRAFGHTRENARDLSEPPATGRSRTPHRQGRICMRRFYDQNSLLAQLINWRGVCLDGNSPFIASREEN